MYRLILCFVLFIALVGKGFTKDIDMPQEYNIIHSITEDWLVHDESYGGYVPYMKNRHTQLKTLSFWLQASQYKPYRLLLYAHKNTYLYIQKKLAYQFIRTGWHSFSVDSLQKHYPQTALFCTFYDAQYRLPLPTVAIVIKNQKNLQQAENFPTSKPVKNTLDRIPRSPDYKDWAILSWAIILVLHTILYNYNPKTFTSFFSFKSSLSTLSRKDSNLINKPFNAINFLYLGAHGFAISYFYMLWAIHQDNTLSFLAINFKYPLLALFANQLYYWLLIWAVLVGKLILLLSFGRLLTIERQVIHTHYFEYIRFSYLFYSFWIALAGLIFCCYGEYNSYFFATSFYFILFFHLFQGILVSFFLTKQLPFLNLYIFYYLCATELTPWLIGVKMLLF